MGLKLHAHDCQKGTISTFHALGISVLYERVMDVRRGLAQAVSRRFAEDGVVVPSNIKRGVSTTGRVDNIDESGCIELHGTAIFLTNQLTRDPPPPPLSLDAPEAVTVQLPSDFASVQYIDEYAEAWLNHLYKVLTEKDGVFQSTPVTYSGFLSHNQCEEDVRPRATIGVFPIFYDTASTMAMPKHAMFVIKKAIEFVNPGQVPVIEEE